MVKAVEPGEKYSALSSIYDSPRALRNLLEQQGLGMQKKFGQNFLINREARQRLVDALELPADQPLVWEVGPGLGCMTTLLLERGCRVRAFEIDRGFARILRDLYGEGENFKLIEGDVLHTWQNIMKQERPDYLLGNLPYNIASLILARLIEGNLIFKRMVVLVQREMAERMLASAGTAQYSSFSVLCQSLYTIKSLMILKGASFYPPPKVESQGLLLTARENISLKSYPPLYWSLVRALFASRRKTIKNNLEIFLHMQNLTKKIVVERDLSAASILEAAGLDPSLRAENLSIDQFVTLAITLEHCYGYSG
ncbi:MAG: 16S rRNA (adenine(1518)-N(6)/adenine(1519)-N(6))-dimethyltransferase RsmA [Treponemataceae bacterium]|nr:16S rRNA (adenine(1518)-N(6)/adenine(1519)-N(6))-dimethyltransferase RsmA [Treponemataceae bacterium]